MFVEMRLTAKSVVLDLLSASEDGESNARELIAACGLFDLKENSVRVALARLSADGTIEATSRGAYKIGPDAEVIARQVGAWRHVEQRVRRWDGGWVCVHGARLGRAERAAGRRRERALRMLGMREVRAGLEVRPDNLEGGVAGVRARLAALGLGPDAAVFRAESFDDVLDAKARCAWNGRALDLGYKKTRERLERWMERAPRLDLETAARESFLLGGEAIRQIVFDPLLPEPLVDVGARKAFVETAVRYDAVGRRIWRRLHGVALGIAGSSAIALDEREPMGPHVS